MSINGHLLVKQHGPQMIVKCLVSYRDGIRSLQLGRCPADTLSWGWGTAWNGHVSFLVFESILYMFYVCELRVWIDIFFFRFLDCVVSALRAEPFFTQLPCLWAYLWRGHLFVLPDVKPVVPLINQHTASNTRLFGLILTKHVPF